LAALEREQLSPEAMIYVGDDPELDVDAAAKLGIHTIWVNQTGF
jgi:FMN phosphatase YigB (HAD superfamily)